MKITHDFHIHTYQSLCAKPEATVEYYVQRAEELGLKKIGFANHFWDENIPVCRAKDFYGPQNYEHIRTTLDDMAKIKNDNVKMYFGCEAEYDPARRDVSITPEVAEKFEFLLIPNSHTHMMMPKDYYQPYERHIEFMIQGYEDILNSPVSPYITAMAHPFEAVCCPYNKKILIGMIKDDTYKRLSYKTAKKGIAFEINISDYDRFTPEQIANDEKIRMYKIAKECGCKILFGSDSHTRDRHNHYYKADIVADILELKEDDIAEIAR